MSEEITQLTIGGQKIGLIGLAEIFENLNQQHHFNEAELKNQLLEQVKVQNYLPDSRADDYAQALLREYKKFAGLPVETTVEKPAFPTIRILGPGCAACETMEKDVRAILTELNNAADVDHVRDIKKIAEYGMVRTPSLVINEQIVLNGRSLPKSQLKKLLEEKLKSL
ncbi:thioredoxin family protein [candidate division KSB1 bacterium]|nr:thioredoxin family protein [candidate division KSB1 bacterium]